MSTNNHNIPEMGIKKAMNFIMASANLQIAGIDVAIPYIVGDPGIGKTRFLEMESKRRGFGFVPFHFSLIPIEEIGGIPVFKKLTEETTGTEWSLPDIMTKIHEESIKYEKIIILLDDFHMCSPAHLALGYEMFTEKKLRGYKFPKNSSFILAGNDSAKSGSKQMFGAIINRVSMQKVIPEFDQWEIEYAIPNKINPSIVSFLKNEINKAYFLGEESTNEPWPSPRSWSRFSEMLNVIEEYMPNKDINDIMYIAFGHVGPKASSEFAAYYDIYSKTEMDTIFDKKKDIIIPSSHTDIYIYGMSASHEYTNRVSNEKATMVAKNNAINTVATIITKIGEISIEISVAILKNISDYEIALNRNESKTRKKLYIDEILKEIKSQNPTIDSKITKSITNILSALA